MTNKRLPITATALLLACMNSAPLAAETRAQSCAIYASTAVEQNRWNKQVQCNYKGARWNNDSAGQNKWCMGVRPTITNAETAARKALLAKCYEDKLYMPNLLSIYGSSQSRA